MIDMPTVLQAVNVLRSFSSDCLCLNDPRFAVAAKKINKDAIPDLSNILK
jgi:hypothetical protein